MQFSMNQVILVGNVASDMELKYTPSGTAVCNFRVATSRSVKKNDQWEDVPTFHRIVTWAKLAEHCSERLEKGMFVTIQGRIDNRSYETQSGEKRYISEIVAESVFFRPPKAEKSSKPQKTTTTPPVE